MTEKKWITPFLKQLFVVTGVSLNMSNLGGSFGFPAILLPQLRRPDSPIPIDLNSGSWIASIIGISLFAGNIIVPTLMGKLGRKKTSLITCSTILISWIWIAMATEITSLLIARFLQGLALGINFPSCPIMVGELTSPSNRGFMSSILASSVTASTVVIHILGSYLTWQTTALINAFITATGLAILIFIPESPSWLADQGRYADSEKAYRWLRGSEDEEELEKMLETRKMSNTKSHKFRFKDFLVYVFKTLIKKEFYRPICIMLHLYALSLWTGLPFLVVYSVDTIRSVAGPDVDVATQLSTLDIQRLASAVISLAVIKKVKRKTIFAVTLGVNLASLLIMAAYTYAKAKLLLPYDHPAVGIIILHILMCSMSTGALPLPIIIAGELFPLEYRSLAGGISSVSFSLYYFVTTKTVPYVIKSLGIHGGFLLYAGVTAYCMVVVWVMLPETKDRTLQDIEEEFRGKPKLSSDKEIDANIPLNSDKHKTLDEI